MATPKFADLSKACVDLFLDDFNAGANKLTLKSRAINGTNLKVEGTRSNANGAVAGFIETKFAHKPSGLNVKEKWTTGNVVTTELSVGNVLTYGTDFSIASSFKPTTSGFEDFKFKSSLLREQFAVTLDTNFKGAAASGVFSYGKFLFGGSVNMGKAVSTTIGAAYVEKDYSIASTVADGRTVDISIFHKARPGVTAGAQFGWSKTGATSLGVAGRVVIDETAYVKAKVNQKLDVSLAFVQSLRPGITMALSANLVGSNLSQGGHQLGVSLTLDN
eukprot:m.11808 g.11808  ORF g.11808 m.11808 type:complete len:275 (+) comp6672_c0_seq1:253-1077(+)